METREYNVFKFDELTEDQKEKVIENYYDINVDYEWWIIDEIYNEIAREYGIEIDMKQIAFDLERDHYVAFDTFNHSRSSTWKCPIKIIDSKKFLKKSKVKYNGENYISIGHNHYAGGLISNTIETDYENEEALQETLNEMLEKILDQLKKEYEYLTSREAIIETIEANGYDFTTNGKID